MVSYPRRRLRALSIKKKEMRNITTETSMIKIIDELKEERESLLQRIDLLTIAGDEALKQRNDAMDEVGRLRGTLEKIIQQKAHPETNGNFTFPELVGRIKRIARQALEGSDGA